MNIVHVEVERNIKDVVVSNLEDIDVKVTRL